MLYILAYILLSSSFLYGAELNMKKRPYPDSEEVQEPNKKIKTVDLKVSVEEINNIIDYYNSTYNTSVISYEIIREIYDSYPESFEYMYSKIKSFQDYFANACYECAKKAAEEGHFGLFEFVFKRKYEV